MTQKTNSDSTIVSLDEDDKKILRLLQKDASTPLERIAQKISLSKTAVWNRIQRMRQQGVIIRQAIILDAQKVGFEQTFFVAIKTSRHNSEWLKQLQKIIINTPEVMEAHRLAGDIDYLLKVQVRSTKDFDSFYKKFVSQIELFDVTSRFSMEVLKNETSLPI